MALNKQYSQDFERLYKTWPTWPKGRTKKHLAAKAFDKAKKEFDLTRQDIDEMILLVERMKKDRKSWQRGNKFGPQGLQVWLNQAGWQDEYESIKPVPRGTANHSEHVETPEEAAEKIRQQNERFEQARIAAEKHNEMRARGILH